MHVGLGLLVTHFEGSSVVDRVVRRVMRMFEVDSGSRKSGVWCPKVSVDVRVRREEEEEKEVGGEKFL